MGLISRYVHQLLRSPFYFVPGGLTIPIPPIFFAREIRKRPLRQHPGTVENLNIHLSVSFLHWRNHRPRGLHSTGYWDNLGDWHVNKLKPFLLFFPMHFFLFSFFFCGLLSQRHSHLWIVANSVVLGGKQDWGPCTVPSFWYHYFWAVILIEIALTLQIKLGRFSIYSIEPSFQWKWHLPLFI